LFLYSMIFSLFTVAQVLLTALSTTLLVVATSLTTIQAQGITDLPKRFALPDKLERLTLQCSVPDPTKAPLVVELKNAQGDVLPKPTVTPLGSKGRMNITIEKPLQVGQYRLTATWSPSNATSNTVGDAKECVITVVPSALPEQIPQAFQTIRPVFGQQFGLITELPPSFAPLRENLFLEYALGFDQKQDVPYVEQFASPYIPGTARKVSLALVWKHPQTGERVPFITRTVDTEQLKPEFVGSPVVEPFTPKKGAKSPSSLNEFTCVIKGLGLRYVVPVDVDERSTPPRQVFSEIGDIEISEIGVDVNDARNTLMFFKNQEPDMKAPYKISPENIESKGTFENGVFTVIVRIKNIPKFSDAQQRLLRGALVVKIVASVVNRKASVKASNTLSVPALVSFLLQR